MTLNQRRSRMFFGAGIALLTLLALAIRFYRLDQIPPGLHADEAYNGLDALSLLARPPWAWPIFFPTNNGREPLYIYLSSLLHRLWGPSILSVRLIPALAGALLTPALVWLAWELAPALQVRARARFALWAGLAVLGLLWSQMFSRFGLRISLFLLLEILLWAGLWRAWRTNRLRWWLLAGLLAGLTFYTYLPARTLPAVLLPVAVLAWLRHRDRLRRAATGMGAAALTAALVAAPLALYFARNPAAFVSRTAQVSAFSQGGIPAVLANLGPVLGMAFVRGDGNLLVNVPLRPVLDGFTVAPFLIGLALLVWRARRPAPLFLLSGLGILLLPTLLSEDPPNFGRAIGALPVFVLAIALGLAWLADQAERRWPGGRRYFGVLGWAVLLAAVAMTWRAYFGEWARLPDLYIWWDQGYTALARHMVATAAGDGAVERVYVSPRNADHTTLRYLLRAYPNTPQPLGFDGRICVRVATDRPAHTYFLAAEDFRSPALLQSYLPAGRIQVAVPDPVGNAWATLLVQPTGSDVTFPEMVPMPVLFSDGIALLGYWNSQPQLHAGERLYLRLFWQVLDRPGRDYTTFAHLIRLDEDGVSTQVAGADARPGQGSCATPDWLPGEVVVDELEFWLPDELPAPDGFVYYLEVGFYTLADLQRLAIPGHEDNQIRIGPVPVEGAP